MIGLDEGVELRERNKRGEADSAQGEADSLTDHSLNKRQQIVESLLARSTPVHPNRYYLIAPGWRVSFASFRSVIILLLVNLCFGAKLWFAGHHFPQLRTVEVCLLALFNICYLVTILVEVDYLYRNGAGLDLEFIRHDVKCVYCLSLHSERNIDHCDTCRLCVRGFRHHCGVLGVCLDGFKVVFFALSLVAICFMVVITHLQASDFYKPLFVRVISQLLAKDKSPEKVDLMTNQILDVIQSAFQGRAD